jgi:hypothetical protein
MSTKLPTRIRDIGERSRTQAARSVKTAHVCANWLIGQQLGEIKGHAVRDLLLRGWPTATRDAMLILVRLD